MEAIIKSAGSAVIAYTAHYCVAKLYNYGCVPDGIWGYFKGMLSTGSPICQAGVHIISQTQVSYSTMVMMGVTRVIIDMVAPGMSSK